MEYSRFQATQCAGDKASKDADNDKNLMGSGRGGTCIFPLPFSRGVEYEVEKIDLSASDGRRPKANRRTLGLKHGVYGMEQVTLGWSL